MKAEAKKIAVTEARAVKKTENTAKKNCFKTQTFKDYGLEAWKYGLAKPRLL
jgi:hypothetical protein